MVDEYKIFTQLKIPTFIIAGNKDPTVNVNYLKKVIENTTNCEFISFKNCGHYASLEKPEAFIETLEYITSKIFE